MRATAPQVPRQADNPWSAATCPWSAATCRRFSAVFAGKRLRGSSPEIGLPIALAPQKSGDKSPHSKELTGDLRRARLGLGFHGRLRTVRLDGRFVQRRSGLGVFLLPLDSGLLHPLDFEVVHRLVRLPLNSLGVLPRLPRRKLVYVMFQNRGRKTNDSIGRITQNANSSRQTPPITTGMTHVLRLDRGGDA